ncbi:hypothetical protein [Natronomonas sp. EA1]|uniref:hypothetical protein n=1 Tax=Natronomonas sp. EA1 TaxID=3421655 RepID=UPI003EB7FDCA
MPRTPTPPADLLADWTLTEETTETVFSLPTATVEGHTRLYEDEGLRAQVVEAGGADRRWRFFFTTALEFQPPLAPAVVPMVKPSVVTEAKRTFASDLRERGFENVETGRTETVRVRSGARARLTAYRATLSSGETDLSIRGYLAVWHDDGFLLAGGAYPQGGVSGAEIDPGEYRTELLDLIRAVA